MAMMDPIKVASLAPSVSSSKVNRGMNKYSQLELSKQSSKGKIETPKQTFLGMKNIKSTD